MLRKRTWFGCSSIANCDRLFVVQVISQKALRSFWEEHPHSRTPLLRWYKVMRHTRFDSFASILGPFPSADKVDDWVVFNIGGNKYRLLTSIHFNRSKVYVRHVLTHQDYDRRSWRQ